MAEACLALLCCGKERLLLLRTTLAMARSTALETQDMATSLVCSCAVATTTGFALSWVGGGLCAAAAAATVAVVALADTVLGLTGRAEPGFEPGRALLFVGAAAGAFGDLVLLLGPTLALADTGASVVVSASTAEDGLALPGGLGTSAGVGATVEFLEAVAAAVTAGACLWTLGRLVGALDSPGAAGLRGCVEVD